MYGSTIQDFYSKRSALSRNSQPLFLFWCLVSSRLVLYCNDVLLSWTAALPLYEYDSFLFSCCVCAACVCVCAACTACVCCMHSLGALHAFSDKKSWLI